MQSDHDAAFKVMQKNLPRDPDADPKMDPGGESDEGFSASVSSDETGITIHIDDSSIGAQKPQTFNDVDSLVGYLQGLVPPGETPSAAAPAPMTSSSSPSDGLGIKRQQDQLGVSPTQLARSRAFSDLNSKKSPNPMASFGQGGGI